MSWVKLGDEFADLAEKLSDAAVRTHVEALLWSGRRLLDQLIPKQHLPRFAITADPAAAAAELVDAGWWEDRGDIWYIGLVGGHWQLDRQTVEHDRERHLQRQDRYRRHKRGDHSKCDPKRCDAQRDASRDASRDTSSDDGPSRPVPTPQGEGQGKGAAAAASAPNGSPPPPRERRDCPTCHGATWIEDPDTHAPTGKCPDCAPQPQPMNNTPDPVAAFHQEIDQWLAGRKTS
jgi:hypothetical protein